MTKNTKQMLMMASISTVCAAVVVWASNNVDAVDHLLG